MTAGAILWLTWLAAGLITGCLVGVCILDGNRGGAVLAGLAWFAIAAGGAIYQVRT